MLRLSERLVFTLSNLTYAEWYQTVEKPRLAKITIAERMVNDMSHRYGTVDDVRRCVHCEVAAWNGWKVMCA
jgi:hypothetical protein